MYYVKAVISNRKTPDRVLAGQSYLIRMGKTGTPKNLEDISPNLLYRDLGLRYVLRKKRESSKKEHRNNIF